MRLIELIIILLLSSIPTWAGAQCGAELTDEDLQEMFSQGPAMRSFDTERTRGIMDYPVKVHIARKSNRTGGMGREEVVAAIDELNSYYINANIRFVMLDAIEYIDNDRFYNFHSKDEPILSRIHDISYVINLYFFNDVDKFGGSVCGYAQYPNTYSHTYNNDRIMVRNDCVRNGATLIHEVSHYFSLMHTHGASNTKSELVTRSSYRNCEEAGDGLCDTAADPMLLGKVDGDCLYTKNEYDPNGEKYDPDPRNIMAYSVMGCRDELTKQQYARINWAALKYRNYLKFPGNVKPASSSSSTVVEKEPLSSPSPLTAAARLSGEVLLKIGDQKVKTSLDGNLYTCDEPFYSGTNYRLVLNNEQPAYVYVFGSDLSRQTELLFPLEYQMPKLGHAFQFYALPSTDHLYTLDENTGKDYLCVLYSRKALPINMILYNMENEYGNFMQRLYRVMRDQLVPSPYIAYEKDGRIRFGANATRGSVVPIVIEINHL